MYGPSSLKTSYGNIPVEFTKYNSLNNILDMAINKQMKYFEIIWIMDNRLDPKIDSNKQLNEKREKYFIKI